jgi:hypothetical protein
MIRLGMNLILTVLLVCFAGSTDLPAQTTNQIPDFKEVYDLLRAHATGLSADELNRAAVRGLLSELAPKVSLVGNGSSASTSGAEPLVAKTNVLEGGFAYVRVGRVSDGLADALRDACQGLSGTNKLNGLVLDLRYTGGDNYAAAAAAADLFVKKEQPLLNWGEGMVKSKAKDQALASPLAVLVNSQTTGAAEALTAVLRQAGAGLVLGNPTAGQAMLTQDFPLQNGQRLRIGTTPVQLGDGTAISAQGVQPDISVAVNAQNERAFYADPFRWIPKSNLFAGSDISLTNSAAGTNHPARRPRFSEAELVRERREGADQEDAGAGSAKLSPSPKSEANSSETLDGGTEAPIVHDPVLARALDLLKGLAVVRQYRS